MRLIAFAAVIALVTGDAAAAQKPTPVDPYWEKSGATGSVDHAAWDAFLADYTVLDKDGIRRVEYARAASEGRAALQAYLTHLQGVDPTTLPRPEQFAYWANLYNAATVEIILEAYPVESIRRIGGSLFAPGPWGQDVATVAGRTLTLDNIEHGILRAIWKEPRVHYAVNCASIGCPNLRERAFRGEGLEEALDAAARDYVNHPRGARIRDGRLHVSSIYDWFEIDFGGDDHGVIEHLRKYADPDLAASLEGISRITGDDYDWALNDAN